MASASLGTGVCCEAVRSAILATAWLFVGRLSRRAGLSAIAGLSCPHCIDVRISLHSSLNNLSVQKLNGEGTGSRGSGFMPYA